MPLIFVGGARGTGKSTLLEALKETVPEIEHIRISREVRTSTPRTMFMDEYVGMRRLTPEQQRTAIGGVISRFFSESERNPRKLYILEGHFVSSSYTDSHQSFFPCIGESSRFFQFMVAIKVEPHEIVRRRIKREKLVRPIDLTKREILAEMFEARTLASECDKTLVVCTDTDFFQVLFDRLSGFLPRDTLSIDVQKAVMRR